LIVLLNNPYLSSLATMGSIPVCIGMGGIRIGGSVTAGLRNRG
jgi:hypothetical protein